MKERKTSNKSANKKFQYDQNNKHFTKRKFLFTNINIIYRVR